MNKLVNEGILSKSGKDSFNIERPGVVLFIYLFNYFFTLLNNLLILFKTWMNYRNRNMNLMLWKKKPSARKVHPQCLKVKCTWRHSCLLFPMECHFLLVLVLKLNSKMTMYFWTVAHNVPMQFHQVMVHIFFSLCVYVHPCLF